MNRARTAILYRRVAELFVELAIELETDDKPVKRGRVVQFPNKAPRDELAAAEASRILKEKGLKR